MVNNDSSSVASYSNAAAVLTSVSFFHMVQITQVDFDILFRLQAPSDSQATHTFYSGMDTYTTPFNCPWITDSGASSHMTYIKDEFNSLNFSDKYRSVHIVDRSFSSIVGNE